LASASSYAEDQFVKQPAIRLFKQSKCALIPHDVVAENLVLKGPVQQYGVQ